MIRAWVASLLALFAGVAVSAESCTRYAITFGAVTVTGEPAYDTTRSGVCTAAASLFIAWQNESTTSDFFLVSSQLVNGEADCRITYYRVRLSDGHQYANQTSTNAITTDGTMACPPDPCEENAGRTIWGTGNFSAGACYGGCQTVMELPTLSLFATGPGDDDYESSTSRVSHWRYTGESCPTEPGEGQDEEDLPPEGVEGIACVTTAKGQVCLARERPGCGMFNGQRFCADEIPDDQCVFTEGGDAICVGEAGPVDEEGDLLAEDAAAEYINDLAEPYRINIFRNSTVATSAEPVLGGGAPGSTGEGIKGPPGSEEETGLPEYDEDWDAAGGMSGVISQVGESNWIGVLTGSAAALSGSSECPSVTMDVSFMDASFDIFEAACEYMEPHYGLWTLMMQVAWGLLALRVFWVSGKS